MKNRPINPKAEQQNLAKAGADVRAMVKDRRSGRGKQNGAPAHLPVPPAAQRELSPDDLATAQHFLAEADEGLAIAARTKAALEAYMRHLIAKHGLSGQDSINLRTGAITRVATG
jgi:hypothetical protein